MLEENVLWHDLRKQNITDYELEYIQGLCARSLIFLLLLNNHNPISKLKSRNKYKRTEWSFNYKLMIRLVDCCKCQVVHIDSLGDID